MVPVDEECRMSLLVIDRVDEAHDSLEDPCVLPPHPQCDPLTPNLRQIWSLDGELKLLKSSGVY